MAGSERIKIGILGGGQLARMMMQETPGQPLELHVLTASESDPAARWGGDLTYGNLADPATLRPFFERCDLITFESEFHLAETLRRASAGLPCTFVPSLEALELTQDKLAQKKLCEQLRIPTAPYRVLPAEMPADEARAWLQNTAEAIAEDNDALVLKWSHFGYDGKGTLFFSPGHTPQQRLVEFVEQGRHQGAAIYAERRIDFRRELAQVAIHSVDGAFACYPTVVSEQEQGICKRVYGPATSFGLDEAHAHQAQAFAEAVARGVPLVGVFALELFEDRHGALWLNEMAPRVHNSGHFSLDGADCSQFENHLRAIAGLPLGSTACPTPFAMLNLIGDRELPDPPLPDNLPAHHRLHWYEKDRSRVGRKLGHINTTAESVAGIAERLRELEAVDGAWLATLAAAEQAAK